VFSFVFFLSSFSSFFLSSLHIHTRRWREGSARFLAGALRAPYDIIIFFYFFRWREGSTRFLAGALRAPYDIIIFFYYNIFLGGGKALRVFWRGH
jgi:hypothetical protein